MTRPWTRFASLLGLAFALTGATACTIGAGGGDDGEDGAGDDGAADDGGDDGSDGGDDGPEASRDPFFLPTGQPDNTSAPSVEIDGEGRIHAVYPAYAGGGAYYATCAADCTGPDDVEVVRFPTDGTVANAMLALDGEGRPRVLLSTFTQVHLATCDDGCGDEASWSQAMIVDHQGHREVTGEAFALDPSGNPRFLMHTYVAYLGIGQEAPETLWMACEGGCLDPASWTESRISDQIWQSSALRFDAGGRAHVATVAHVVDAQSSTTLVGAYLSCGAGCGSEDAWGATGLENAYRNDMEAIAMLPAISLGLTSSGKPRIAILGQDESLQRRMVYFACDAADCAVDGAFAGSILTDSEELGAGVDLALDADDRPRVAYTFDYNIALAFCDDADCTVPDAGWDLAPVEISSEMEPDDIFLEWNCDVAAWFLHSPSVAIGPGGLPRVGYQARDISGGWSNPDDDHADCEAGTDMTWSRLAMMPAL
jgi:hypothetical protein